MTVSVLICTYQRHDLLAHALTALICETTSKPDEVVVVNGGDERADEVVETFKRLGIVPVKLIKTRNVNLATSRNVGLARCTGEIIALTDDDARVFPDWVGRMRDTHGAHPEAGVVGGAVLGANTESIVGKVADLVTFPTWPEPRYVRSLPGVNISYKRDVVLRVGPQDESLPRGEDVDYNWRAQKLGYVVYFDPAIKVYHHHRPTVRALLNQFYMYGRSYLLVRRKWHDMYCIYPRGIHHWKDVAKVVNFSAEAFYGPLLTSKGLPRWKERVAAIPLLTAVGFAWRAGIFMQAMETLGDVASQNRPR